MNPIKLTNGHKTQIVALVTLLAGFAVTHGWIERDVSDVVLSVVGILLSGSIVHHEVKKKAGK